MQALIHDQIINGVVRPLHFLEPEIFADNEKKGRSGHMSHAMTEFAPGRVIDFYSNCSAKRLGGHAAFGWVEYRVSEDYGRTFGPERILPYSYDTLMDGIHSVSVEKAVTAPDGTIVAIGLINSQMVPICCEPYDQPQIIRSLSQGDSWEKPFPLCPYKGRVYDALVIDGSIYILMFCNPSDISFMGCRPDHLYRLFRSDDCGKSFTEVCVVPFLSTFGLTYGNMILNQKGELIVYAYDGNDEFNMHVLVSPDLGKSWKPECRSFVAQRIRNPQVGCLDGQYILHGRSGENKGSPWGFVFYTSADGIHWDGGHLLSHGRPACYYSNNLVLRHPDGKNRMLVQYSENIADPNPDKWTGVVNCMHMWIENAE